MQNKTHTIRSYVKRDQRMTVGQERALVSEWSKYGLDITAGYINFPEECILEIGFGMGHSLAEMAHKYPEKMFIGVEVHLPGIGALLSRITKAEIKNIRIFNNDIKIILNQCIIDNYLSQILILFPDPWPKNRHKKRRLVQPEFISSLFVKLKPSGILHLATDCESYAYEMLKNIEAHTGFLNCAGKGKLSPRPDRPITKFEQRSVAIDGKIYELIFKKL